MADLFADGVLGLPADLDDYNSNWSQVELSFEDLSPGVVSGLAISAGAGLAVAVTAGAAFIGGHVVKAAGFSISGLAPSTTNHIYLQQNGTGTSNTTGTQPANTAKLGTALTDVSGVLSVAQNWASGRQVVVALNVHNHGGGAGHPDSIDLASWHATNVEGNEVRGVLPAGALPAGGGANAQSTKTTNYTATAADYYLWVDCTGGAVTITLPTAVGAGGKTYVIKKIDSTANAVTIATTSSQTIDGAATLSIPTQWASFSVASNNANWFIY